MNPQEEPIKRTYANLLGGGSSISSPSNVATESQSTPSKDCSLTNNTNNVKMIKTSKAGGVVKPEQTKTSTEDSGGSKRLIRTIRPIDVRKLQQSGLDRKIAEALSKQKQQKIVITNKKPNPNVSSNEKKQFAILKEPPVGGAQTSPKPLPVLPTKPKTASNSVPKQAPTQLSYSVKPTSRTLPVVIPSTSTAPLPVAPVVTTSPKPTLTTKPIVPPKITITGPEASNVSDHNKQEIVNHKEHMKEFTPEQRMKHVKSLLHKKILQRQNSDKSESSQTAPITGPEIRIKQDGHCTQMSPNRPRIINGNKQFRQQQTNQQLPNNEVVYNNSKQYVLPPVSSSNFGRQSHQMLPLKSFNPAPQQTNQWDQQMLYKRQYATYNMPANISGRSNSFPNIVGGAYDVGSYGQNFPYNDMNDDYGKHWMVPQDDWKVSNSLSTSLNVDHKNCIQTSTPSVTPHTYAIQRPIKGEFSGRGVSETRPYTISNSNSYFVPIPSQNVSNSPQFEVVKEQETATSLPYNKTTLMKPQMKHLHHQEYPLEQKYDPPSPIVNVRNIEGFAETTPTNKVITKPKTPQKSPQDIARKLDFENDGDKEKQKSPGGGAGGSNNTKTDCSTIQTVHNLLYPNLPSNNIPKASVKPVHTPPSLSRQRIVVPDVSPLKTPFPTANVPQETPLPTIDTFKKPYPLPDTSYYHMLQQDMSTIGASSISSGGEDLNTAAAAYRDQRSSDENFHNNPNTLHTMPDENVVCDKTPVVHVAPNSLIVLENKVLSQDEMIDLTALRLSTSKIDTPQRFARPHKPIPEVVIKQEKLDDLATQSENSQTSNLATQAKANKEKDQQTQNLGFTLTSSKHNRKYVINASKLKLPPEKIADLAKRIAESTVANRNNNGSNVSIAISSSQQQQQQPQRDNGNIMATTQRLANSIPNQINQNQIIGNFFVNTSATQKIPTTNFTKKVFLIVKKEPSSSTTISSNAKEIGSIKPPTDYNPLIKVEKPETKIKIEPSMENDHKSAAVPLKYSPNKYRKPAVEIIEDSDEDNASEEDFSAVDFIASLNHSNPITEETQLELSPEELNLNASCAMNFSPLRIPFSPRKGKLPPYSHRYLPNNPVYNNDETLGESSIDIGKIVMLKQENSVVSIVEPKNISLQSDDHTIGVDSVVTDCDGTTKLCETPNISTENFSQIIGLKETDERSKQTKPVDDKEPMSNELNLDNNKISQDISIKEIQTLKPLSEEALDKSVNNILETVPDPDVGECDKAFQNIQPVEPSTKQIIIKVISPSKLSPMKKTQIMEPNKGQADLSQNIDRSLEEVTRNEEKLTSEDIAKQSDKCQDVEIPTPTIVNRSEKLINLKSILKVTSSPQVDTTEKDNNYVNIPLEDSISIPMEDKSMPIANNNSMPATKKRISRFKKGKINLVQRNKSGPSVKSGINSSEVSNMTEDTTIESHNSDGEAAKELPQYSGVTIESQPTDTEPSTLRKANELQTMENTLSISKDHTDLVKETNSKDTSKLLTSISDDNTKGVFDNTQHMAEDPEQIVTNPVGISNYENNMHMAIKETTEPLVITIHPIESSGNPIVSRTETCLESHDIVETSMKNSSNDDSIHIQKGKSILLSDTFPETPKESLLASKPQKDQDREETIENCMGPTPTTSDGSNISSQSNAYKSLSEIQKENTSIDSLQEICIQNDPNMTQILSEEPKVTKRNVALKLINPPKMPKRKTINKNTEDTIHTPPITIPKELQQASVSLVDIVKNPPTDLATKPPQIPFKRKAEQVTKVESKLEEIKGIKNLLQQIKKTDVIAADHNYSGKDTSSAKDSDELETSTKTFKNKKDGGKDLKTLRKSEESKTIENPIQSSSQRSQKHKEVLKISSDQYSPSNNEVLQKPLQATKIVENSVDLETTGNLVKSCDKISQKHKETLKISSNQSPLINDEVLQKPKILEDKQIRSKKRRKSDGDFVPNPADTISIGREKDVCENIVIENEMSYIPSPINRRRSTRHGLCSSAMDSNKTESEIETKPSSKRQRKIQAQEIFDDSKIPAKDNENQKSSLRTRRLSKFNEIPISSSPTPLSVFDTIKSTEIATPTKANLLLIKPCEVLLEHIKHTEKDPSLSSNSMDVEDSCQDSTEQGIEKPHTSNPRKRLRKTLDDIKKSHKIDSDSDGDRDFGEDEIPCNEFLGFVESDKRMENTKDIVKKEKNSPIKVSTTTKGGTLKNWLTTGKAISPTSSREGQTKRLRHDRKSYAIRGIPLKKRWDASQQSCFREETDITDDDSPVNDDQDEELQMPEKTIGNKRNLKSVIDNSNKELIEIKRFKLDEEEEDNEKSELMKPKSLLAMSKAKISETDSDTPICVGKRLKKPRRRLISNDFDEEDPVTNNVKRIEDNGEMTKVLNSFEPQLEKDNETPKSIKSAMQTVDPVKATKVKDNLGKEEALVAPPKKRGRKPANKSLIAEREEKPIVVGVDEKSVVVGQQDDDTKAATAIKSNSDTKKEISLETKNNLETPIPMAKGKRGRKRKVDTEENKNENAINPSETSSSAAAIEKPINSENIFNPRLLLITKREQLETDEILTVAASGIGPIQCALCLKRTTESKWITHLAEHYGVGWKLGKEHELNIHYRPAVVNAIMAYIKDTGIKGLNCRMCKKLYRSALGLMMHIEGCGIERQRMDCEFCHKNYSYSSYPIHVRSCPERTKLYRAKDEHLNDENNIEEVVLSVTGRAKRHSTMRAESKLKQMGAALTKENEECPDFNPLDHIRYNAPLGDDVREKWSSDITKFAKAFCPKKLCSFSSDKLDALEEHTKQCRHILKVGYYCTYCKRRCFETEKEAVDHVNSVHRSNEDFVASDSDCNIKTDDEASSNDEDDGVSDVIDDDGQSENTSIQKRKSPNKSHQISVRKKIFQIRSRDGPKDVVLQKWHNFIRSNYSSKMLFCDFKPQYSMLKTQYNAKYLPRQEESMKFAFKKNGKLHSSIGEPEDNIEWRQMKRYQAINDKTDAFLFVGSPVVCCAWLPLPAQVEEQYLLVAHRKDMFKFTKFLNPKHHKTSLLLFKVKQPKQHDGPQIQLHYAIAIEDGPVYNVSFLPSGGYNREENRLGVVAVASVESNVKVYALPIELENAERNMDDVPLINITPSFELKLDILEENQAETHQLMCPQCLQIQWSEYSGHQHIFASFSNGFIAIWDVTNDSEENLNRFEMDGGSIKYAPINYFYVGEKGIRYIALHYDTSGPRWLAVNCFYRRFVIYDIRNLMEPIPLKEDSAKNVVRNMDWCPIWEPVMIAYCDSIPNNGRCVLNVNPTNVMFQQQKLDNFVSAATCIHYTPLTNTCIASVDNGDIVFMDTREIHYEHVVGKKFGERRILSCMDVKQLDGKPIERFDNIKKKNESKPLENEWCMYDYNYKEKYGLVFQSFIKLRESLKNAYFNDNRRAPLNIVPYMRINTLRYNLNECGSNLIAVGYENGFIRIIYFDKKSHFRNW
ncbi:uncharacterized protein LOC142233045 isoform X2 [Haematobia irritans]|uniref:uncharacterized protein LOC142233045 isoform X2 n=1 Tax=Haematobia irritans TaxID=7368 RepID=UPI003F4F7AF5